MLIPLYLSLEKAMGIKDRFDGHIVSGHVDGLAEVVSLENMARSIEIEFKVPGSLKKYIVRKGSVCLDGVSLTVNKVKDDIFSIMIIPHTQTQTIIQHYTVGTQVNLEVDLMARYAERFGNLV